MDKDYRSPAIQLLQLVWDGPSSRSWRTLNCSMHKATVLAINSGLHFDKEDFKLIASQFRISYWGGDAESFYSAAVAAQNTSATKSFEEWAGRTPFIFRGQVRSNAMSGSRHNERLSVGAHIKWHDEWVTITSFNDTKKEPYVVACSFWTPEVKMVLDRTRGKDNNASLKVKHLYRITHSTLKESRG